MFTLYEIITLAYNTLKDKTTRDKYYYLSMKNNFSVTLKSSQKEQL